MTFIFYLIVDTLAIIFCFVASREQKNPVTQYRFTNNKLVISNYKITYYKVFIVLSFVTLLSVVALRDNVGADYSSYANVYSKINAGTLTEIESNWLSIGFQYLCKIIGLFAPENYVVMFAIVGFMTLYFFYKSFYSLSVNLTMSLYLFISFCLYYQCFNQSRQMLAISMTTFAVVYLKENNMIKFNCMIILAALFHTSAAAVLILGFMKKLKLNHRNVFLYCIIGMGCYMGFDTIKIILSYTNYGETYLNWSRYNTTYEMSSIMNLILRVFICGFCLKFSRKTIERAPYTIHLYNAAIICTVLQLLTLKLYILGRVTTYFWVAYIFLIPEVLITVNNYLSSNSKKYFLIILIAGLFVYHAVYYYSSSGAIGSGYNYYKMLGVDFIL